MAARGGGRQGVWDRHRTHCYVQCITSKALLYGTGNSAQCSVAAGMFGGEWIHVDVWLSSFSVHLKPSQHCSSAILQYKIKSSKER